MTLPRTTQFQPLRYRPAKRLIITVAIAFVLALSLATPAVAASLSPVKGLMALKTMAQQSVPYDKAMADEKPTVL